MASNLFPPGVDLYTIGYVVLKYPELPPPPRMPMPAGNQLGFLQRTPLHAQKRIMAQVASQYLITFLEYQCSDAQELHDSSSSQYYLSNGLAFLNWMTSNPDVATRIAQHPKLLHDVIEKLLDLNIEKDMKACSRAGGSSYESDFGTMLQFVSTILLRQEHLQHPVHPRINELVPKLKAWKHKYGGNYIARVSDRLADQITNPESLDLEAVREAQKDMLICGYIKCNNEENLSACGKCRIMRYCSIEHQKSDWKSHKKICCKGFLEVESGTESGTGTTEVSNQDS